MIMKYIFMVLLALMITGSMAFNSQDNNAAQIISDFIFTFILIHILYNIIVQIYKILKWMLIQLNKEVIMTHDYAKTKEKDV